MKITLYILTLVVFLASTSIAQGIKFEKGTWAEIQAKAKKENKHIFVDAYTTWCGPCKWQSKKVFPQKEVGDFFNKNFVSFKLDMEKGEGVDFAKQYKVRAFPTLVYFNPKGELVHRTTGANPAKVLLKQAGEALNPETQFVSLQKRFDKGENDLDFLKKYIAATKGAYQDFTKPTEMYLNQLGKKKWATAEGWAFIKEFVVKSSLDAFVYVVQNQGKFEQLAKKKKEVSNFIERGLSYDMQKVARSKDQNKLEAYKSKLNKLFGKEADKHIIKTEYFFYRSNKEKGLKYASKYLRTSSNVNELAMAAWQYYNQFDTPDHLNAALEWIDKAIKLDYHFRTYNIKVKILMKMKRYKEAKKAAEETLRLAKKDSKQYVKMAQKQLDEVNAKL